ncbi:MFS transporter [Actinocrispum wychmicini]|uniref:Putative MFS family arabinose efflux permease n=1 Tax=Actinocrispum wychmicini TaxID=1213861 RepID=A0A4R2J8F8_9PSEU|nr:MFS transporter [Actinocrispum wychmicini]TCO54904.1 putative MFS family arabinose efflux permease [Actinocrispum wychmicini]
MSDFRRLWFGQTVSLLGSSVGSVALSLVTVVTLHADPFTVGLVNAAYWLPWLAIGLPAGAWVDRLGRHRLVMMTGDAVSFLAFASVPVAAWFGALTVAHVLVATLVGGCAKVFFTMAYRAFVPALVRGDDLLTANAKLQASESTTQVVGPGLAGLLAQILTAATGVLVDALSFLVSLLYLRKTGDYRQAPRPRQRLRTEIGEGLRFVAHDPLLRVLTCFGAVSNLALTGYQSLAVVFLVRDVGVDSAIVGVMFAVGGMGGVVGSLIAGRLARRFGTARAVLLCQVFGLPPALLIPLTQPGIGLVVFGVGVLAAGVGVVASNVIQGTFRQRYCPPEMFARIMASGSVVNYGTIPLAGVLSGGLADAFGVRTTMWLMTGLSAASVLILLASRIRRLRDFPVPLSAPVG